MSAPVGAAVVFVLLAYGLSIGPDEMPSWFPWAAGGLLMVILALVAASADSYFAAQKQREYDDKQG